MFYLITLLVGGIFFFANLLIDCRFYLYIKFINVTFCSFNIFFGGWLNTALFGKGSHRCPQERRGTFHPQSRMKTSASVI